MSTNHTAPLNAQNKLQHTPQQQPTAPALQPTASPPKVSPLLLGTPAAQPAARTAAPNARPRTGQRGRLWSPTVVDSHPAVSANKSSSVIGSNKYTAQQRRAYSSRGSSPTPTPCNTAQNSPVSSNTNLPQPTAPSSASATADATAAAAVSAKPIKHQRGKQPSNTTLWQHINNSTAPSSSTSTVSNPTSDDNTVIANTSQTSAPYVPAAYPPPRLQRGVPLITFTTPAAPARLPANFQPNGGYSIHDVALMRGNMPSVKRMGVKPAKMEMYKTEMCRGLLEHGRCNYGDNCKFAHKPEELRPKIVDNSYKTEQCGNYLAQGWCRFDDRCKFLHDEQRITLDTDRAILVTNRGELAREQVNTNHKKAAAILSYPTNSMSGAAGVPYAGIQHPLFITPQIYHTFQPPIQAVSPYMVQPVSPIYEYTVAGAPSMDGVYSGGADGMLFYDPTTPSSTLFAAPDQPPLMSSSSIHGMAGQAVSADMSMATQPPMMDPVWSINNDAPIFSFQPAYDASSNPYAVNTDHPAN